MWHRSPLPHHREFQFGRYRQSNSSGWYHDRIELEVREGLLCWLAVGLAAGLLAALSAGLLSQAGLLAQAGRLKR